MSRSRLFTVFAARNSVNFELESALNEVRTGDVPESKIGGMAQLFDPKGQPNIICRLGFAERWCSGNSDWKFEAL